MEKSTDKRYSVPPFVQFDEEVLSSIAFRKLSASGIRILLRFLQKRKWKASGKGNYYRKVYENSGLVFTYHEAESSLGIKQGTFFDAVTRLITVGFIDVEYHGGANVGDYSRYSFSDRWRAYGTPKFIEAQRERVLTPGRDIQSNIKKKKDRLKRLKISRDPISLVGNGQVIPMSEINVPSL
jgi:hypothetical protein